MIEKQFNFNVNKYQIEKEEKYFAHLDVIDAQKIVNALNELAIKCSSLEKENEQLKNEINMLKTTIARNESYIKKITETSKWSN